MTYQRATFQFAQGDAESARLVDQWLASRSRDIVSILEASRYGQQTFHVVAKARALAKLPQRLARLQKQESKKRAAANASMSTAVAVKDPVRNARAEVVQRAATELSDEAIRRRAYEIWEREGRPEGQAEAHWQRAVVELSRDLDR